MVWSSAAEPPTVRDLAGFVVLEPPGEPAPLSVPVEDVWVDGPGGPIHALLRRPAGSVRTPAEGRGLPLIVDVHGGPTHHDADVFRASPAAWVDHGFAVVQVNYRGSTGYGSAWRDALESRIGHVELEDVVAVRDQLVREGIADGDRVVLAGGSWGGYLTLLGLGVYPDRWTLGLAAVPVADYVAAYEDEMEGLKAFDRSLFGGSPEEVPDKYRDSSPITYVDAVRAPVLILAGENDPRCPIRQIDNYVAALEQREIEYGVYRYDAGHGSLVDDEVVRQVRAELAFVAGHLPGGLPRPGHS
jgi:dipeptidyl aminopeptidase/acylaminoacyl peptidase